MPFDTHRRERVKLAGYVPGSPWFNSSAALVHNQVVFLQAVVFPFLLRLFELLGYFEIFRGLPGNIY